MSHQHTAWTHTAGSLPSNRIAAPKLAQKDAQKGKQKNAGGPQSREVRRLAQLRDGLVSLGGGTLSKDPKGGCYCQGM